jgi:ketosteroid isomerase-like protein
MPVTASDRVVVESLFRAMQAGPGGEEKMLALFWEDAVFIEPFSGQPVTHTGHAAIRESFRQQTAHPLPDMKLTLDRVDMDGSMVRAEWTCASSAFPAPMQGHDLFTIRNGKIARLEIVVAAMPGMAG